MYMCINVCVCVYVYIFNHCYFSLTKVPSGADVFFYLSTVHVGNALPLLQLPPSLSHLHVSGHCGTVNTAECCYVDHVCGLVGPKLQLPGSTGSPHRLGLHTWFGDSLQFCIFIVYHLSSNVSQFVLALQLNCFSIWIDGMFGLQRVVNTKRVINAK